jgi:hypothetical protein
MGTNQVFTLRWMRVERKINYGSNDTDAKSVP